MSTSLGGTGRNGTGPRYLGPFIGLETFSMLREKSHLHHEFEQRRKDLTLLVTCYFFVPRYLGCVILSSPDSSLHSALKSNNW